MINILQAANVAQDVIKEASELASGTTRLDVVIEQLLSLCVSAGKSILLASVVFFVGRFAVSMINKFVASLLNRRKVDATIQSFLKSLINILLTILLVITVVGTLGVNTTSFAALLASAGVAVGMALSGNLQNLAGGLIILLFKPYRVGDWIEAQDTSGAVKEIQIFHTIITTLDGRIVYIPNGAMSSNIVSNFSKNELRQIQWIVGVDYGENSEKVEQTLLEIVSTDTRVLNEPKPFVAIHALDSSSVNFVLRVWVNNNNYWPVYFDMNKKIYETFNSKGINFPYPQLTVHTEA